MLKKAWMGLNVFIIFSLIVINISGCTRKEKTLKVAIITWVGYGPVYVAQEKGFFNEEGLNVEITKIEDTGARHAALTNNEVQVAINTIDAFASGVSEGLPAKVFLKVDDSFGGDGIVATNDIKDISQLKGKTVAYPQGLPSHFFLLYLLDKNGLTSQDIVSRTMEAGDAGAAFISKKVDAAVTWEPWLTQASQTEHGHIITTSKESPGLIVDIMVANKQTCENRGDDLKKFLKAWFKAIEYVKKNPKESNQIMGNGLGITPEDFEAMVTGIMYADYNENLRYFGIKPQGQNEFSEVFNTAGKIWVREGLIKNAVDASKVQVLSYLADLYKE